MTQGETRMVMTERARGAVLQRSQSGNTIVASDLTAALDAVRNHPKDGVVWQTSDEPPSAWLLRVSGGVPQDTVSESKLIRDQEETTHLAEKELLSKAARIDSEVKEMPERIVLPAEEALRLTPEMLSVEERNEPDVPDRSLLRRVVSADSISKDETDRQARADNEPLLGKTATERAVANRIVNELANSERDIIRQPDIGERGRMPEHDEQTLSRTIQKER
jgi:hypothetical protein